MSAVDPLPLPDPAACRQCGAPPEPGYATPLCANCRDGFVRRPLPKWIIAAALLVAGCVVFALFRLPAAVTAAAAFGRGQSDVEAGRPEDAVAKFEQALARYPDSTEIRGNLALAQLGAGHQAEAAQILLSLRGKKIEDRRLLQKLQAAFQELSDGRPKVASPADAR